MAPETSGDEKRRLIADAIQGVRYHYHYPDLPRKEPGYGEAIFAYPFMDYLKLLYQQPCYISFWLADEQRGEDPAFSSFPEKDRLFLGMSADPETSHVVRVPLEHSTGQALTVMVAPLKEPPRFRDVEAADLEFILQDGKQNGKPSNAELVAAAIRSCRLIAESATWAEDEYKSLARPSGRLQDVRRTVVNVIRARLTDLYRRLREADAFQSSGSWPINLFTVFRYHCGQTPRELEPNGRSLPPYLYTASIILSEEQRREIPNVVHAARLDIDADRAADLMETQLGPDSRAIADSIFESGTIDFGLLSELSKPAVCRDYPPAHLSSEEDRLRKLVENAVYETIHEGAPYRILYTPVHVNGTPWMGIYTFSRESEDAWMRHYYIYRDVVPTLASSMRELAHAAYRDALITLLEGALREYEWRSGALEAVNEVWRLAARYFPFGRPSLHRSADGRIPFVDGSNCRIKWSGDDNPALARQVKFDPLNKLTLEGLVSDALAYARSMSEAREASAAYAVGHPVGYRTGRVRAYLSGIDAELRSITSTSAEEIARCKEYVGKANDALQSVEGLGTILDFLSRIVRAADPLDVYVEDRFRNDLPFPSSSRDLKACLMSIADRMTFLPQSTPLTLEGIDTLSDTSIGCWIDDEYRPFDGLYEEVFAELLMNAAKHGRLSESRDCIPVSVELLEIPTGEVELEGIVGTSGVSPAWIVLGTVRRARRNLSLPDGEWITWDEMDAETRSKRVGGLFFVSHCLSRSQAGRLWVRQSTGVAGTTFSVGVFLRGLTRKGVS